MTEVTILYVDHAPAMGGAEYSLLELLAALDRDRFRPVLAAEGPLAEAARELGVVVEPVPLGRVRRSASAPWHLSRGTVALCRVIDRQQAAIVHANTLRAAGYAALATALCHRPLVWHVRDILPPGPSARWLCHRAQAVIAISGAVARALPCAQKAQVIYNPVAVPPAHPRTRSELGLPTEGLLVASVGRLRRWKGHHTFLQAAALVSSAEARFVVIGGRVFKEGPGDHGAELADIAARLGIADRVTFTGQRPDLADIWPHLSVVVHAATAEPFGRVVAEAQAAGVPVAAFRDGGVPEIVADGQSGLLVEPGDFAGLARAIDRLLADSPWRAQLGRRGQRLARERFDPARHTRAVEGVYNRLLAGWS